MSPSRDDAKKAGRQALSGLKGTLAQRIAGVLQRDPELLGEMVELGLDAAGFRDPRNAGGPGEKSEPLTLGQVAELLSSFEPQELDRLFTNLSDLRAFLSGTPSVSF